MEEYYHNILSENLLSNVDEKRMKEIADYKIDKSAIRKRRKGLIKNYQLSGLIGPKVGLKQLNIQILMLYWKNLLLNGR